MTCCDGDAIDVAAAQRVMLLRCVLPHVLMVAQRVVALCYDDDDDE